MHKLFKFLVNKADTCILYTSLTFAKFNREHARCLAFLKEAVSSSNARKKIVVTHHVPSFQMQCPKFADSLANGAFTVELEDYIKDSGIDFWIYGHSHYNADVRIGNTCLLYTSGLSEARLTALKSSRTLPTIWKKTSSWNCRRKKH